MPRDTNLVQNPDLVRRIATALGMRTAHVAPSVAPTIQPVIIADDLSGAQRKSTEGQLSGLVRSVGGLCTLTTGAATEAAAVFYNYPGVPPGPGFGFRVSLRYLELHARGIGVTNVQVGWRDVNTNSVPLAAEGGLDSILDPAHVSREFTLPMGPALNPAGLGVYFLSPATGVSVAGAQFYGRTTGLAPLEFLTMRSQDFPVVVGKGRGLVVQVFAAPTVASCDLFTVWDIEEYT